MSPQFSQIEDISRIRIGDQLFNFRCFLVNPERRFFIIKPDAIKNLTIADTFNNYYASGSLTITNTSDLIERPAILDRNQQVTAPSYLFRGDARDILRVSISPVLQSSKTTAVDSDRVKSLLTLEFEFAIYNIEEIPGDTPGSKYKRLYFHELYHQIMLEKNTDYATRGKVKTGIAIKELLQNSLPVSDGFNIKYDNFDEGSTTINFASPAK